MNHPTLTPAEWHVMECLWENDPCTARRAVEYLGETAGWARSTTLTLLRRMTEKGQIRCNGEGAVLTYSPLLKREEAALDQTQSFLDRVYQGSISMMLSAFTKKQSLSDREIEELYTILENARNQK